MHPVAAPIRANNHIDLGNNLLVGTWRSAETCVAVEDAHSNFSSRRESESKLMTSPYNARAAYSVSIVAVDRRNLEILMAAAYLFEAMPVF